MAVASDKLARALAGRLSSALPARFRVDHSGNSVRLFAAEELLVATRAPGIVEQNDSRSLAEKVYTAALAVMTTVQDDIMQQLKAEWPADARGKAGTPGARVDNGQVFLWYGDDEKHPIIALSPIDLADLEG